MEDIAIIANGLSKQYSLKARDFNSLRDTLSNLILLPIQRMFDPTQPSYASRNEQNSFWALHDATFEIRRGEVLGIIGRNGSGKSTLLKILARITKPTLGSAEIRGRVGAILEVGSGFHPELTGRENIYLNGSILGMKRAEIDRKFDEIVDFAEVHRFIDTPVKYYSSGMYVRLAFSVAAQLDTEVLLVDEVLAVGDLGFIDKSLKKMEALTREGRTVVIVSHIVDMVKPLCDRIMLIENGRIAQLGDPDDVITTYKQNLFEGDVTAAPEIKVR